MFPPSDAGFAAWTRPRDWTACRNCSWSRPRRRRPPLPRFPALWRSRFLSSARWSAGWPNGWVRGRTEPRLAGPILADRGLFPGRARTAASLRTTFFALPTILTWEASPARAYFESWSPERRMWEETEKLKRQLPLLDYLRRLHWSFRPAGRQEFLGLCLLHAETQ